MIYINHNLINTSTLVSFKKHIEDGEFKKIEQECFANKGMEIEFDWLIPTILELVSNEDTNKDTLVFRIKRLFVLLVSLSENKNNIYINRDIYNQNISYPLENKLLIDIDDFLFGVTEKIDTNKIIEHNFSEDEQKEIGKLFFKSLSA
ncbi:MAG: hypothetical protein KBC42_00705 [Candidatus Pacebacteria bacterium]|nr:hypothetical protein [Candidatus Paceibacterota bacterium]MBP9780428.1 hypothetical protein [Candidatus Paceibacterota bacterium]